MAPIRSFTATLCGMLFVHHWVAPLHPQVISGIIPALGIIFSCIWECIMVAILALLGAPIRFVLEVHPTGITPVFPLTPRTAIGGIVSFALAVAL